MAFTYPLQSILLIVIWLAGLAQKATQMHEEASPEEVCRIGKKVERAVPAWAYSPSDLEMLARFEADLYMEFGSSTKKGNPLFERAELIVPLEEWIADYSETSLKATAGIPEGARRLSAVCAHPFLVQRLLNRGRYLGVFAESTGLHIDAKTNEGRFFQKVKNLGAKIKFPTSEDVRNSMHNILTTKATYGFSVDDLLRGKFGDIDTNYGLEIGIAYDLGLVAYEMEMYSEALDWLYAVYTRLTRNPDEGKGQILNGTVLQLMLEVSQKHDLLLDQIAEDPKLDQWHIFNHKISSKETLMTRGNEEIQEFMETQDKLNSNRHFPGYCLLCSGTEYQPEALKAKLRCWLESKSDPAWTINPLKMEVYSWDPYLVEIHEAIGDGTLEFLREVSIPNMGRAAVIHVADNGSSSNAVSTYRTATRTMLLETIEGIREPIQALDRRIGRMTGLAVSNVGDPLSTASESFQVSAYSVGGTFGPHVDALSGHGDKQHGAVGDRVATFMIYLNNVHRGGYTVFPKIGVSIVPKRGSAIFWYDLYRNGTADQRTAHAGCPVILGQKWIATKWIRLYASFQKRMCSLEPLE